MSDSPGEITTLLHAWSAGDQTALERLMPLVNARLRQLARRRMARERPEHTLQPTALINEVFLRLIGANLPWKNRKQFFGIFANLMRRALVDHARVRGSQKRGGGALRVELNEGVAVQRERHVDLLALDRALEKLKTVLPRKAEVVEFRFFVGLTVEETAEVLEISSDTVKKDWTFAKLWLLQELGGAAPQ